MQVLHGLRQLEDPRLLIGSASADDAAVYKLDDERALIQTVDFFTPVVDDPYLYGQIAACNSLSDVYAMGGRPLTAMNIVAMPDDKLPPEIINAILRGGAEMTARAGAVLAGGHTVVAPEPLYGLSVTGLAHPDRIIDNRLARAGDVLLLTKALGTGILTTAIKRGTASEEAIDVVTASMCELNTPGATLAERGLVRAGTDITGFGLLGHLANICRSSGVGARLDSASMPALHPSVVPLIEQGCVPGGTRGNLESAAAFCTFADHVSESVRLLAADAQTSGGLLLCIAPQHLAEAADMIAAECGRPPVRIGEITAASDPEGLIHIE